MAQPKIEEGYTPIANKLLEQVYKLKLNGTQFKIIMAVWRYTYGFSRKEHKLSVSFISESVDVDIRTIKREVNKLISLNLLEVKSEATFNSTRILGFNKNYDAWILNDHQVVKMTPGDENDTTPGGELPTKTGGELPTQDKQILKQNIKQKERRKKNKQEVKYSENDNLNNTIQDYIDFRKTIKRPMTERAIKLLLKNLNDLEPRDIDRQIAVLEQSIMNGWIGVFKLKGDIGGKDDRDNGKQFSNGYGKVLTGSEIIEQCRIEAEERGETWELPYTDGPFK